MPGAPWIASALTVAMSVADATPSDDPASDAADLWQACRLLVVELETECTDEGALGDGSAQRALGAVHICERAREFTLKTGISTVSRASFEVQHLMAAHLKAHACAPHEIGPAEAGLLSATTLVEELEPLAGDDPDAADYLVKAREHVETLKLVLAEIKSRKTRDVAEVQAALPADPCPEPPERPEREFPVSLRVEVGYAYVGKINFRGFGLRAFLQSNHRVSRRIRLRFGAMAGYDDDDALPDGSKWERIQIVHAGGHGEASVALYRNLVAAILGVDFGMQFTKSTERDFDAAVRSDDPDKILNTPAGAASVHLCLGDTVFCAGARVGGQMVRVLPTDGVGQRKHALSVGVVVGVDVVRGIRALNRVREKKSTPSP